MQKLCFILILCILNFSISFSKEELLEKEIDLKTVDEKCELEEFCEKYIKDVQIEDFIKKELKNDYIIISLDKCLNLAFMNNLGIKIENHTYKSSKYEYQNALSNFLPILSLTSYVTDYRGQILVGGVLDDKFHETALSVNATVEHKLLEGGRQIFEAKAKNSLKRLKGHQYNYKKNEVVFLTTKYYYELLLRKLSIATYLRNLIERNAQLNYTKALFEIGLGSGFDVVRSKNEVAQAKISLLNSLNDFRFSQAKLANIIGFQAEVPIMPFEKEIKALDILPLDKKMEYYLDMALLNREDLKGLKNLISYHKNLKSIHLTDFLPKPSFSFQGQAQGTFGGQIGPNYIATLFLKWYPGQNTIMGTITNIKAQKENIKAKILEYQCKLSNIHQEIVRTFYTNTLTKRQIQLIKDKLDYSDKSIQQALARFKSGNGIFIDVIEAQTDMTKTRNEYNTIMAKYNISQIELLFQSGILFKDEIIKSYLP